MLSYSSHGSEGADFLVSIGGGFGVGFVHLQSRTIVNRESSSLDPGPNSGTRVDDDMISRASCFFLVLLWAGGGQLKPCMYI